MQELSNKQLEKLSKELGLKIVYVKLKGGKR